MFDTEKRGIFLYYCIVLVCVRAGFIIFIMFMLSVCECVLFKHIHTPLCANPPHPHPHIPGLRPT